MTNDQQANDQNMNELRIFFTALMFYTRIPVPISTGYSDENLNKATRYFPIMGLIVGGLAALIFYGGQFILPKEIALLLSMAASIYITGAFHEDGFADFCDGFGGGYTREKVLTIMKDSRIGTYGSVGLMLILLVKFFSLNSIETVSIPLILVTAHAFSRVFPVFMIYTTSYSRMDATSKTKPVGKKGSAFSIIFAVVTGFALLYFIHWVAIALAFVICFLIFFVFRAYVLRKIDGYTGDVLGALQQLSEIGFYISYLIHLQAISWI
jgi:adenosylcobinamide-GDP ribazoletransferase